MKKYMDVLVCFMLWGDFVRWDCTGLESCYSLVLDRNQALVDIARLLV
jgi:hypothetical protein